MRWVALLAAWRIAAPAAAYRTSEDSASDQARGITGRIAYEPLLVPFAVYRGTDDVGTGGPMGWLARAAPARLGWRRGR